MYLDRRLLSDARTLAWSIFAPVAAGDERAQPRGVGTLSPVELSHGGVSGRRYLWDLSDGSDVCIVEPPESHEGIDKAWLYTITAATLVTKQGIRGTEDYMLVVATATKVRAVFFMA